MSDTGHHLTDEERARIAMIADAVLDVSVHCAYATFAPLRATAATNR